MTLTNQSVQEQVSGEGEESPIGGTRRAREQQSEQTGKRSGGWIGVDLDGTLALYGGWKGPGTIGDPIPLMVERVKKWLAAEKTVKIFTARMHGHGMALIGGGVEDVKTPIEQWCLKHIGQVLPITNAKDFGMIELWDDRCIQVEVNTGIPVGSNKDRKRKPYPKALTCAANPEANHEAKTSSVSGEQPNKVPNKSLAGRGEGEG
jgi:hypothetical protein